MDCIIRIVKTKAPISFAVTAKLICVFVFAYAKSRLSHDAAHMLSDVLSLISFIRDHVACVKYLSRENTNMLNWIIGLDYCKSQIQCSKCSR